MTVLLAKYARAFHSGDSWEIRKNADAISTFVSAHWNDDWYPQKD